MTFFDGRRKFLTTIRNFAAAGGIFGRAPLLSAATAGKAGEDYYDKLGITKIINAAGTYTNLTASTMPPPVQAAVARAAENPVRLVDLQKAAGEYLAGKLKCEGALVSAGAASAVTLGTAACVMIANKVGIRAIPPEIPRLKNEVIIQKGHRYGYEHAILCCGVRLVEVETIEQYEAAFNERTVMAHLSVGAPYRTLRSCFDMKVSSVSIFSDPWLGCSSLRVSEFLGKAAI